MAVGVARRVPEHGGAADAELVERIAGIGMEPEIVVAARSTLPGDPLLVVAHHQHRPIGDPAVRSSSHSSCSVVICPVVSPGIAVSSRATTSPGSSIH